jgi:hypothetical protein
MKFDMKNSIVLKSRFNAALAALLFLPCFSLHSCTKYLDAKPQASLEIPSTLQDYQAILDEEAFNEDFAYGASVASDDYFLGFNDWESLDVNSRNTYVWNPAAANDQDWSYGYINILRCNVVLAGIDQVPVSGSGVAEKNNIRGSAAFFRAYTFYGLANVFTLPYRAASSNTDPGLPLRLQADITEKTVRSTLEQTYGQVIADLKTAAVLLPVTPTIKTRPSRPAAFAVLARVYLEMQDYTHANQYADSSLLLYSKLIDYNTLDTSSLNPFVLFNDEVSFHALDSGSGDVVDPYYARVDSSLYASYALTDLRKRLFYSYVGDGHYAFKGDYSGQSYGQLFAGMATDEVYLIRAETYARLGKADLAIADLNTLLVTRYAQGEYMPYSASMGADAALALILSERRKELVFRSGSRWSDLKRLNQDTRFATTLVRNLDGKLYTLPPGDKRYAFLLPVSVIQASGVQQNGR